MASAVSRDGPRAFVFVLHFQLHCTLAVAQSHVARISRQSVRGGTVPRSHYSSDAVEGLEDRRVARHHEVGAGLEHGALGKGVIHRAGDAVAADGFIECLGVKQFDIFKLVAEAGIFARMIHDFRDHQPRASAGGAERLAVQLLGDDGRVAGHVLEAAELRRGKLVGGTAGHRHAEKHLRGRARRHGQRAQ